MRAQKWARQSLGGAVFASLLVGAAGVAGAQAPQNTGDHGVQRRDAAFAQDKGAEVKDDLFSGTEKFAKGASDITEVTMDPESLGMVDGSDAKRAHSMVLNVVRTYEYDKPGMYRVEDVEEFRRKLNTGDWHCSVHTRDLKSGESTDICNKHRTDGLMESAIITVEPKQLTFIHTIRKANGGSSLNVPEMGESMDGVGAELALMSPALANVGPMMAALQPQIAVELQELHGELAKVQVGSPKIGGSIAGRDRTAAG